MNKFRQSCAQFITICRWKSNLVHSTSVWQLQRRLSRVNTSLSLKCLRVWRVLAGHSGRLAAELSSPALVDVPDLWVPSQRPGSSDRQYDHPRLNRTNRFLPGWLVEVSDDLFRRDLGRRSRFCAGGDA